MWGIFILDYLQIDGITILELIKPRSNKFVTFGAVKNNVFALGKKVSTAFIKHIFVGFKG